VIKSTLSPLFLASANIIQLVIDINELVIQTSINVMVRQTKWASE